MYRCLVNQKQKETKGHNENNSVRLLRKVLEGGRNGWKHDWTIIGKHFQVVLLAAMKTNIHKNSPEPLPHQGSPRVEVSAGVFGAGA